MNVKKSYHDALVASRDEAHAEADAAKLLLEAAEQELSDVQEQFAATSGQIASDKAEDIGTVAVEVVTEMLLLVTDDLAPENYALRKALFAGLADFKHSIDLAVENKLVQWEGPDHMTAERALVRLGDALIAYTEAKVDG